MDVQSFWRRLWPKSRFSTYGQFSFFERAAAALIVMSAGMLSVTSAQSEFGTNDLVLIPEDNSLWKESLLWSKDVVLRAGFGYKDNVLLSPETPKSSPFFTTGLDLTIFRLPLDGWEVNVTMIGDDVRYTRSPGGLDAEDLFIASSQVQKYFSRVWRAGAELRYSYVDQVLQEFLSAGGAQAIEAKGHLLGFRPFVRRELWTNWWIQAELPLAREWWREPLDSVWKLGGQVLLGFNYSGRSHIALSGGGFYVPHEEWLARDARGNELPGKELALWRNVVELKWEHHWDAANRWSTGARLGFNYASDNGGGFFDYYRYTAAGDIRFHTKDWEVKSSAAMSYYDFPVQPVGPPPSSTLYLTTVGVSLRAERRVYKSLRCFAAFEFERTVSNDPVSEYDYRIWSGGMSWEF
jgi:hypothetical protein